MQGGRFIQLGIFLWAMLQSAGLLCGAETFLRLEYAEMPGATPTSAVTYREPEYRFSAGGTRRIVDFSLASTELASNHEWIDLMLVAPLGQVIQPGFYQAASESNYHQNSEPLISLGITGESRSGLPGNFRIKHIAYGTNGALSSLWAIFENESYQAVPTLCGELKYNMEPSTELSMPLYQSVSIGEELIFPVSFDGTLGVEGQIPTISLESSPSGGELVLQGPTNGQFRWVPAPGQVGRHRVTLVLRSATSVVDIATTLVDVQGELLVFFQTEPGIYPGSGGTMFLDESNSRFITLHDLYSNGVAVVSASTNGLDGLEVSFALPGGKKLTPGVYEDAGPYVPVFRDPYRAALGIGSAFDGRGRFEIHEVKYGGANTNHVISFHASFQHFMNGDHPVAWGEVKFNADPSAPTNLRPRALCEPVVIDCPPSRGVSVEVSASISDEEGDAVTVHWFINEKRVKTETAVSGVTSNGVQLSLTSRVAIGTNSVRIEVRDTAGNSNVCHSTIRVVADVVPPTMVCSPDVIVTNKPGRGWAKVPLALPEVGDNCSTPVLSLRRSDHRGMSGVFSIGLTEVMWRAADRFGNETNWSQWVEVIDRDKPYVRAYPIKPKDAPSMTRHRESCYTVRARDNSGRPVSIWVNDTSQSVGYGPFKNPARVQVVRVPSGTNFSVTYDRRSDVYVLPVVENASVYATDSAGNTSEAIRLQAAPVQRLGDR